MDIQLEKKMWVSLNSKNRRWLVILAVAGLSSYGVYKVYYLPSIVRQRKRLLKLVGATISVAEMIFDSAETMNVLVNDLKEYLTSNSDDTPRSLRQISKLARSPEVSESLIRVFQALTIGILRGLNSEAQSGNSLVSSGNSGAGFADKVMDRLFSDSGKGFVSVVVGSFARNSVLGFITAINDRDGKLKSSDAPDWIDLVSGDEKCKRLILSCVEKFVGTAVTVFLDKTMHINTYDDFFAGLTNPKHQSRVRDVMVSVCSSAVESFVKTSHQVLSNGDRNSESSSKDKQVSSSLALPSNKKLFLDVTIETVKSVVECAMTKMSDGVKRSLKVAQAEAVGRGMEVVNYVGAKSYVILTICLALYLHIVGGSRLILPA